MGPAQRYVVFGNESSLSMCRVAVAQATGRVISDPHIRHIANEDSDVGALPGLIERSGHFLGTPAGASMKTIGVVLSSVGPGRVFAPASSSGNGPHLMSRDFGWRRFSSAGANYFREEPPGRREGNPNSLTRRGFRKLTARTMCRRAIQSTWMQCAAKALLSSSLEREGPLDSYMAKAGLPLAKVGRRR
jgi:hypothetical protein